MRLTTRRAISIFGSLLAVGLLFHTYGSDFTPSPKTLSKTPSPVLKPRQTKIAAAFQHAWDGYSKYCFGHDSLRPVTNTCEDEFGGLGATALDALSTAIMLDKPDIVHQILSFIQDVDFTDVKQGTKLQTFEVTIRHFGGIISAWDLLHGPFEHVAGDEGLRRALYRQMVKLGDALSCSFDPVSGIPRDWVDPKACATDQGTANTLAGVGTMILEFARLSEVTGDDKYVKLAQRAEEYLLKPEPEAGEPFPGLLGSMVKVHNGHLAGGRGSWGAFGDSFYEYLIKAYLYDPTTYASYLPRWLTAVDSTIHHIGSHPYGHPDWTMLGNWHNGNIQRRTDSLAMFAGGNIILGGMVTGNDSLVEYGLQIADAAGGVYGMTKTGLGGEILTWRVNCSASEDGEAAADDVTAKEQHCRNHPISIDDASYNMRPEVLETWYYAYRATRDPKYTQWSWSAFEAINKYCKTESGFSAIKDVMNGVDGGGWRDKQESFLYAEVLKYIWLIHLEDEQNPFHVQDSRTGVKNTWVYNTEAHPFRVAGRPV